MNKQIPMPEAIEGRTWVVKEQPALVVAMGLGGICDPKGFMSVPFGDSDKERFIRLHEMAHAKWTPTTMSPTKIAKRAKCTERDVQVVEDCRVQSLLAKNNCIPSQLRYHSKETSESTGTNLANAKLEQPAEVEHLVHHILQYARANKYNKLGSLNQATKQELSEFIDAYQATHIANEKEAYAKDVFKRAKEIATQVAKQLAAGHKGIANPKNTPKAAALMRRLLNENKEEHETEKSAPGDKDEYMKRMQEGNSNTNQWAPLHAITTLPLTEQITSAETNRTMRKAIIMGPRIGRIHRMLTDNKMFTRPKKRKFLGGTILIDASGSMSISSSTINALIKRAPASIIALYSGNYTDPQSSSSCPINTGGLYIIARNGRAAKTSEIDKVRKFFGRGNMVDGPALKWLAKQPEPRTWICDGQVTGLYDTYGSNLFKQADLFRRQAKAKRHQNISDYAKSINLKLQHED